MAIKIAGNRVLDYDALSFSNTNIAVGHQALNALTTGLYNSAVGHQALFSLTTGTYNTAMGIDSMSTHTTGVFNTAVGMATLRTNTIGDRNTAVGAEAMRLNTTGVQNTAIGTAALYSNTNGTNNVAIGYIASNLNTTGFDNVAVGVAALQSNIIGSNNTAIGRAALVSSIASNNTAVGYTALHQNTTGTLNIAVGSFALYYNSIGTHNVGVGYLAAHRNTTGTDNVAVGSQALQENTVGSYNTAMGRFALYLNTTSYENTAMGYLSLYSNTTGDQNTAIGSTALYANTTGTRNVAVGYVSLRFNTTGFRNTALGSFSLYDLTTGTNNTALGYNTGIGITTGGKNTIIGANVTGLSTTLANTVIIADGDGNQRIYVDSSGNIGAATTNPKTKLSVGAKVADDNSYSYDANAIYAVHQTATATATLNDPKEILLLARQGTGGQAFGAAASFRLSRYENAGTSNVGSRTRLDLVLAHDSFLTSPTTVLTALSSGNVGIGGITNPSSLLHVYKTTAPDVSIKIEHSSTNPAYLLFTTSQGTASIGMGNYSGTGFTNNLQLVCSGGIHLNPGSGNVGIGTSNPDALLTVNGVGAFGDGSASGPSIANTGDLNTGFWFPAADTIAASTGGSERMRIDSSGYVLVNTASQPSATGGNTPRMTVVGSTRTHFAHGENQLLLLPAANNGAANGDAGFYMWISEPAQTWTGAGIARNMYNTTSWPRVNSSLTGQMIRFDEGTGIIFTSETSGGTRYTPLTLSAADAAFGGVVTATGEIRAGGTTDNGAYNLQSNGTGVWGAGAYVNGSDARLKTDILDIDTGLDIINSIRPVSFKYKPEYSKDRNIQTGFIAQELKEVLKEQIYVDGIVQQGPEFLSVAYQSIIPLLVKAIQELSDQNKQLAEEINKLKG